MWFYLFMLERFFFSLSKEIFLSSICQRMCKWSALFLLLSDYRNLLIHPALNSPIQKGSSKSLKTNMSPPLHPTRVKQNCPSSVLYVDINFASDDDCPSCIGISGSASFSSTGPQASLEWEPCVDFLVASPSDFPSSPHTQINVLSQKIVLSKTSNLLQKKQQQIPECSRVMRKWTHPALPVQDGPEDSSLPEGEVVRRSLSI